jgi:cysteinyl-tRNA synthetase
VTEQNNYRELFWSNLADEDAKQNLEDLMNQTITEFRQGNAEPLIDDFDTDQFQKHLQQIQEASEQARKAERENQIELVRDAAEMYLLQGDLRGVEVCLEIESLINKNAETEQAAEDDLTGEAGQ